jgi:hypothetical protein
VAARGFAPQNVNVEHVEEWCAQGDDFRTFLGDFMASLTQFVFSDGLSL